VLSAGVLAVLTAGGVSVAAQPGVMWSMHGWWAASTVGTPVRTIDAAAERVRQVLAAWGDPDLALEEIMKFSNHFYAVVIGKNTGIGAFELLVAPSGAVYPEPGPNMMWNTKYGHLAGVLSTCPGMSGAQGSGMMKMMGGPGVGSAPSGAALTKDRARPLAAQYLARVLPGTVPDEGTAFYGYFTFDVERAGRPIGMLSVERVHGTGVVPHLARHLRGGEALL